MVFIIAPAGMLLLIPEILFLTLFVENILFLDSLIIAVAGAVWIRSMTEMHPVFCILCGIGLLAGSMLLYTQRHVFWLFTVMSSVVWGSMIGHLLHDITNDWIWGIFIGMVVGAAAIFFHIASHHSLR